MTDTLSDDEMHSIMHSLGTANGGRWSYRNYCFGIDDTCERLVERGFMVKRTIIGLDLSELTFYQVTDAGIHATGLGYRVRNCDRIKTDAS